MSDIAILLQSPKDPEEDKIDAGLRGLRTLCLVMKSLQDELAAQEEKASATRLKLDEIRLRKIPEAMESLGIKNATFQGIGRVQLAADLYCSTREGKKAEAMQWLRDMGLDDMISETYNASSMKALVRRLIEDGAEIPEFMNVAPFIRASIVRA